MSLSPELNQLVADEATNQGVDPALVYRTIQAESSGNQYGPGGSVLTSSAGARGLGQLEPATARGLGVDPDDPAQNIRGTVAYLKQLSDRYDGDPHMISMAYNAGPGAVDAGRITTGTRAYAAKVAGGLKSANQGDDIDPVFSDSPSQAPAGSSPQAPAAASGQASGEIDPIFADPAPTSSRSSSASQQPTMGDGSAVDSETGAAVNAAQTDAVRRMKDFDPQAAPGSAQRPYYLKNEAEAQWVPAGAYYLDTRGNLQQQPGALKPNFALGLQVGAEKPLDNLALAADSGLRGLGSLVGAPTWTDDLSHALGAPSVRESIQAHQQAIQDAASKGQAPGFWGKLLGEGATSGLMLTTGGVGGALVKDAIPALAPTFGAITSGYPGAALSGAVGGALTTDGRDPSTIAGDALKGAVGGALLHGIIGAAGGFIGPKLSTAAQVMKDAGVMMTPGGQLGGMAKTAEDKLSSVPFLFAGDAIKAGQRASIASFNRGATNMALAPIGEELPASVAAGHDAIAHAQNAIGAAYDRILPNVTLSGDQQLANDIQDIRNNQLNALPDGHRAQFNQIIRDNIVPRINPNASLDGAAFKLGDSNIGRLAAQYESDPDTNNRMLGYALSDAQGALRDALARQNPLYAQPLSDANAAWAMFSRLRKAASSLGADDGVFTPKMLKAAARSGDNSVAKGAFARGDALLQPYAEAGAKTVGNSYPDSGTAGRLLLNPVNVLGPLYTLDKAGTGGLAATGAAAAVDGLYGSDLGRRIMSAAMSDRPQWAQDVGAALQAKTAIRSMFGSMAPIIQDTRDRPAHPLGWRPQ